MSGTGLRLFAPWDLAGLSLPNRIVMAPMTRNRSPNQVPSDLVAEHYALRASAGLIIAESTHVEARGQTAPDTPGIYTDEQEAAWSQVTAAVHAAGGRIVLQLAHAGRLTHSDYHGQLPIAPSPVSPAGVVRTPLGTREYEVPVEASVEDIGQLVSAFGAASARARRAGFDGVEIHGAHGFLIDQFLQSKTNVRTDAYGGSAERRRQFLREVLQAVQASWPVGRVGLTLSPGGSHKGIGDEDPVATFSGLVRELDSTSLGWLHLADIPVGDTRPSEWLRPLFSRTLIVSEGYTRETAEEALEAGLADLVAFGKAYTANPDLVEVYRQGARGKFWDAGTFYSSGRRGYLPDYDPD